MHFRSHSTKPVKLPLYFIKVVYRPWCFNGVYKVWILSETHGWCCWAVRVWHSTFFKTGLCLDKNIAIIHILCSFRKVVAKTEQRGSCGMVRLGVLGIKISPSANPSHFPSIEAFYLLVKLMANRFQSPFGIPPFNLCCCLEGSNYQ